ncbi:DNA adenine methylase [Halocatena halophila]|uniref:DNA adenine methylase n=1 Tax=Halocatena halophila TaxID=2814576 RepID=UPI002ED3E8D6
MNDSKIKSYERPNNCVSVFPYPGGKGRRCEWILSKLPPHTCFVDVFGGSGAVLYNKSQSTVEIYNDINDDLVQFFTVLREREDELLEWVRSVPYARTVYDEWVSDFFDGYRPEDEIERAGRFFTLRYMQFSGEIAMRNGFKVRAKRSPARTFDNARERIYELSERFRQVIIENQDYRDILKKYDDSDVDVVFYCDPPYVGGEHYYGTKFDHTEFVESLTDVNGRWMVSYSELPSGLNDYHVLSRDRHHRMCRESSEATEHLVCNFDPAVTPSFVDHETKQRKLTEVA